MGLKSIFYKPGKQGDDMGQMFKPMVLAGLICLPVFFCSNAHAQFFGQGRDHAGMKEKMEWRIQEIYGQLNLSDEQKKLLEENKAKHKASKEAFGNELKAAMQAVGEQLKQKDLDLNKINGLRSDLKRLRDQMADERFDAILEVRKILTQEQFTRFVDLVEKEKRD